MSENIQSPMYQFLSKTYFLPLIATWPLAVGLSGVYKNATTQEYIPIRKVGPSRKCRYPLDLDHSDVLNLPDGRKLGYAQYGAPDGRPVFYLHGHPGSRLEGASWEGVGKRLNARIISVDRPGIGWSTPQPGRKLVDHAKDIEHLAEHLELQRWAVLGVSGGGPYAVSCAAAHPADKLKSVGVLTGLGRPDMNHKGMRWIGQLATYLPSFVLPHMAKLAFWGDITTKLHLDDEYRLSILRDQVARMPKQECDKVMYADQDRLDDDMRLTLVSHRQTFGQGFDGVARDSQVLASRDDGFRIEDVRKDLPIHFWGGTKDVNVSPSHGEQYAARIGSENAQVRMEEETHSSMQFKYREQLLETLLEGF